MLRFTRFAHRFVLASPVLLLALSVSPAARADGLPPDSCGTTATAGQTCTTAGDGTEDGICAYETCTSHLFDGGHGSYACLLCELPDAGPLSTDAGPTAPDAGPVIPDAVPSNAGQDAGQVQQLASRSSCEVGVVGGGGAGGVSLLLGGVGAAFAFAASRRRRRG